MLLRMLIFLGLTVIVRAQTDTPAVDRPEYGGPSVLSRGMGPSVLSREQNISLRPSIGINGICDTGLTAYTINAAGKLPNKVACGIEGTAGLAAFHKWRQSNLSVTYSGNYRHYPTSSYYDGIDQTLSLGFSHTLSKRMQFIFKENAGTFARAYGDYTALGFYDPSAFASPNYLPVDNRVYYVQSTADLTYRLSPRLSFNFGAGFDEMQYRAASLYSSTAVSAHGDIAYRYSKFGTIGLAYEFVHIHFRNIFGGSDVHNLSLTYALRMSSTWELRAQAGATRVESLALEAVPVDPIIAAITGQSVGILAVYQLNYVPNATVSLAKKLPHGSLTFGYDRSVSPGNGVFLTSQQETASANYQYTGIRRWSLFASGGYNRLSSFLQTTGKYDAYFAGGGVSRSLSKGLHVTFNIDERRYDAGFAGFKRNASRATLGLTWSPGDVPLIFW